MWYHSDQPFGLGMSCLTLILHDCRHAGRARRALVLGLLVLLVLGAVAGLALGRQRYRALLAPVGPGPDQVFQVHRGESTARLATRLAGDGLIRDARVFRLRARERKLAGRFQTGAYLLSPAAGVDTLLDILSTGRVAEVKITFPEGYTLDDMAQRCAERKFCDAAEYQRLATAEAASFGLDDLPSGASLEGYLFPDTYRLPVTAGARELIQAQIKRFVQVWQSIEAKATSDHSRPEIVTIASLVEKEARRDSERAKVAGVVENRLRAGMRLEFCSTVQYALGVHRERLLYRDLRVDSPYNTYKVKGLPPGPIANPGRPSLLAAARPAQHKYLFFVLAADGRHLFGTTAAEHQRNKAAGERARGVR